MIDVHGDYQFPNNSNYFFFYENEEEVKEVNHEGYVIHLLESN